MFVGWWTGKDGSYGEGWWLEVGYMLWVCRFIDDLVLIRGLGVLLGCLTVG
ncbi:hypothetical protein [Candidatus Hodgkinia cicadicola]|uniref:hypothetical protein n=1 Tax=Candidatus Hodgkinia cicadicola TaxID=573658 RepID=UPI001788D226